VIRFEPIGRECVDRSIQSMNKFHTSEYYIGISDEFLDIIKFIEFRQNNYYMHGTNGLTTLSAYIGTL